MTNTMTTVRELLAHYIENHEYGIKQNTIDCWLKPAVSKLEKFLERPAMITDLNLKSVNGYIDWLKANSSSTEACRSRRGPVLLLVRYGTDLGLVAKFEGRIRKIRIVRKTPVGWTAAEVQKLLTLCLDNQYIIKKNLASADNHPRTIKHNRLDTGPRLGLFIGGLVAVSWDTTLRLNDSLAIRWDCLEFDSTGTARAQVLMQKTSYPQAITISAETIKILRRIEADSIVKSDLVLHWPYRREKLYDWIRAFVRDAGIRKGSMKFIRKGSASAAENLCRGAGKISLGHRSDWISAAHYLVPSIVGACDIAKPSLFGTVPAAAQATATSPEAAPSGLTGTEALLLKLYRQADTAKRDEILGGLV